MTVHGAGEQIRAAVLVWEGLESRPHRFGGTEYRLKDREIGHVHADRVVDLPFPKRLRDELVGAGFAEPHHLFPQSGWVSFYIREPADVERAIALLRRSYDLALAQRNERRGS
jgi:luciferase-like monooxygenase